MTLQNDKTNLLVPYISSVRSIPTGQRKNNKITKDNTITILICENVLSTKKLTDCHSDKK